MMMIQMILYLYDMSTFEVKYQLTVYFLHKKQPKDRYANCTEIAPVKFEMFQIDDEYDIDE